MYFFLFGSLVKLGDDSILTGKGDNDDDEDNDNFIEALLVTCSMNCNAPKGECRFVAI